MFLLQQNATPLESISCKTMQQLATTLQQAQL